MDLKKFFSIVTVISVLLFSTECINISAEDNIFAMVKHKYLYNTKNLLLNNQIILSLNPDTEFIKSNGINICYASTDFRMSDKSLNELTALLNSVSYDKSFVLYDINSGGIIGYNYETYFPVASTIKAPMVLTCLQSVDRGEHSFDETIKYSSSFNSSGSGIIKNSSYGTVYSLEEIMEYTVTVSDNVGYYMLQNHFGYAQYGGMLFYDKDLSMWQYFK